MPGRDYTQAYARLERSLRSNGDFDDTLRPYSLSNGHLRSPTLFDWADEDDDPYESSSTLTPPPPLSALNRFPPTPPSNTRPSDSPRDRGQNIITPPNQQSPPTPDTTPPSAINNLAPKLDHGEYYRQPSPYTESFRTAKEDQYSAIDDASDFYGSPRPEDMTPRAVDHDQNQDLHSLGLGIDDISQNGVDKSKAEQPSSLYKPGAGLISAWDTVMPTDNFDDEWNSNRFRNVTLRKRQHQIIGQEEITADKVEEIEDSTTEEAITPTRYIDESRHLGDRVTSPELGAEESDGPVTPPNPSSYRSLEDKHHSAGSSTSPVIPAMVVDSPPLKQQTLRHVSKNQSLRDERSTSSHSTRNSLSMDDSSPHRLVHKPKNVGDRKSRWSVESDMSAGSRSLRRRQESLPTRPMTAPEATNQDNGVLPEFVGLNVEPSFATSGNGIAYHRTVSDYLDDKDDDADMVDDAVTRALITKPSPSATPNVQERFHDSPAQEVGLKSADQTTSEPQSHSAAEQAEVPVYLSTANNHAESTNSADAARKANAESSFTRSDGTSPPIFFTRDSLISMNTGTPEVVEANAVSIYPHNNDSLRVVQNTSREQSMEIKEEVPTTQVQEPQLTIEPATPITNQHNFDTVDSPLKNPRKAPELPVVAIIPPTPAKELDAAEEAAAAATAAAAAAPPSAAPTRRVSLLKKARRYSDTLIQPIKTFAIPSSGTLRHRAVSPPSVSEQQSNLHPFWRPRRFWNDFSDSEDEYDEDEYYDDNGDRLPPGGDTSDIAPPANSNKSKWRRGGSLRGFLVGNSLGLQRGPTNKRRHVVNLPAGLSEPQRSLEERRQMNAEASANASTAEQHTSVRASARRSASSQGSSKSTGMLWLDGWRSKMRDRSRRRDEKTKEAKRDKLRASIGPSWYFDQDESGRVRPDDVPAA